jgi:hypothetical protein
VSQLLLMAPAPAQAPALVPVPTPALFQASGLRLPATFATLIPNLGLRLGAARLSRRIHLALHWSLRKPQLE